MKYLLITKDGIAVYSSFDKFSVAIQALDNSGLVYINMSLNFLTHIPTTNSYSFWCVSDSTAASVADAYSVT